MSVEHRTVTSVTARRAIHKLIAKQRPGFLWGPPGIGKSEVVAGIAKELGGLMIDLRLGQMDPTDIRGIPFFNKNNEKMDWAPPIDLPDEELASQYPVIVLFLDEMNSAAPAVQAASSAAAQAASAVQAAQAVVVNMLDQKLWNPNPDFLSYTLSKAALEAANTLLAQALAPLVRVVGVAPGLTLTSHMLGDDKFEQLHKLSPLGRSSSVEEVVSTVVFAVQNRGITGTTLLVDGGQHLTPFQRDFSMMGQADA